VFKIKDIRKIYHIEGISKALSEGIDRAYCFENGVCDSFMLEQLVFHENYKLSRRELKSAKKLLEFCNENEIDEFYYKDDED